ncbi:MAG: redoxin family protein [Parcubacteria group bacterium]|nr:redoxin family protein [Parcubacteria group bacterium]
MREQSNLAGVNAPEFPQGLTWLNSGPISLRGTKDKIFLLEFWTYSCVNCLRVLPYLKRWHEKYASLGLTVVGIHTPEFKFEKDEANVGRALQELGVTFPVVLDNDYSLWNLYSNHWWPRKLLINSKGQIVYDHVGEGDYEETETKIAGLLRQDLRLAREKIPQPESPVPDAGGKVCYQTTPETYLGYERGKIGTGSFVKDVPTQYETPSVTNLHNWYLSGLWTVAPEYVAHAEDLPTHTAFLILNYQSVAVHCVISSPKPVELFVTFNSWNLTHTNAGKDVVIREDGKSILRITEPRMYNIIQNSELHEGELRIVVKDAGVRFHVFTFGGCPGQI